MRRRAVALLVVVVALAACAERARDPAAPATIVVKPPDAVEAIVDPVAEPAPTVAEAPAELPPAWTGPIVPGLTFADAIGKARATRDAYARLGRPMVPAAGSVAKPGVVTPSPIPADGPTKAWFSRAQLLVDQASRMYAAAFHAPDAPGDGRIDAIAEAAELDMTIARALDEAGLDSLPRDWRSDPGVGSTFEDVAVGPMRRWRDEARVLARACVETAREIGVATDAARRCASLRTGAAPKLTKVTRSVDAGAPCACAPGDPLCSSTLGGWCAP
ncbi:MAG: hypothetical protein KF819_26770 [Labilithrix sp.]|nr:hypothetical protein [Labilithrix sp.]